MSSRKKRKAGDENASNRNLDGRRIRTINEAKALAEYLAVKPEMDKREKDERRKRWAAVVEMAEKREEEIRSGKGKGRLDGAWVEAKEEAAERTREAVLASLTRGEVRSVLAGAGVEGVKESDSSGSGSEEDGSESEEADEIEGHETVAGPSKVKAELKVASKSSGSQAAVQAPRTFFGWDEDEDMSSDDDDEEQETSK